MQRHEGPTAGRAGAPSAVYSCEVLGRRVEVRGKGQKMPRDAAGQLERGVIREECTAKVYSGALTLVSSPRRTNYLLGVNWGEVCQILMNQAFAWTWTDS